MLGIVEQEKRKRDLAQTLLSILKPGRCKRTLNKLYQISIRPI